MGFPFKGNAIISDAEFTIPILSFGGIPKPALVRFSNCYLRPKAIHQLASQGAS
jgi:hypothetical protein